MDSVWRDEIDRNFKLLMDKISAFSRGGFSLPNPISKSPFHSVNRSTAQSKGVRISKVESFEARSLKMKRTALKRYSRRWETGVL